MTVRVGCATGNDKELYLLCSLHIYHLFNSRVLAVAF